MLGKYGRLEKFAVLLGLVLIPTYLVVLALGWSGNSSRLAESISMALLVYIELLGLAVMFVTRGRGVVRAKRWVRWMLVCAAVLGFLLIAYEFAFPESSFIDITIDEMNVVGVVASGFALGFAMFIIGLLMVPFAFACTWLMTKVMSRYLPGFLMAIRDHDPEDRRDVIGRLRCWLVDLPSVLDASTLTFDAELAKRKSTKRRWLNVLLWQLALGLLIAIYVSLNPVLLEGMNYTEVFGFATYIAFAIPFLILPWSTLESLGARVKGVRKDFFLHDGAKSRMIQTLVALGTIVLIVRLAVTEIGAGEIASAFAIYTMGLASLSGLVSFFYFNYFERDLIEDLLKGVEREGQQ